VKCVWAGRDLTRATSAVTQASAFPVSSKRPPPLQSPLTTHKGMCRFYSKPDLHWKGEGAPCAGSTFVLLFRRGCIITRYNCSKKWHTLRIVLYFTSPIGITNQRIVQTQTGYGWHLFSIRYENVSKLRQFSDKQIYVTGISTVFFETLICQMFGRYNILVCKYNFPLD
jgi:hypothetical protein